MDKFIVKRSRLDLGVHVEEVQPTLPAQVSSEPVIEVDASTATATAPASPVCNNDVSKSSVGTRVTRPFKREWLTKYPWLIYDETNYKAFCSTCQNANQKRLLDSSKSVKQSFISDGFNNWKHAIERFNGHEKSDCHRTAVSKLASLAKGVNVCSGLSMAKRDDMIKARTALHRIVTSLVYLSKQGLAVRGKTDSTANFNELLTLRATDVPDLQSWLARTKYRWISHEIQNEILNILATNIMDQILQEVQKSVWYSIMVDETTDCTRNEQMVFCFRICNEELEVHEMFISFCDLQQQDAETLFNTVKQVLNNNKVEISNCRGQCFDGAANVAGHLNGLQAKIRDVEPRAVYVHCAAHSLNLVVQDAIANVSCYRDGMNMFGAMINFIRDSPKRLRMFEKIQEPDANALRPFCPTRWVLRESALTSVLQNFTEVTTFMDEVSLNDRGDAGAKAAGFSNQLGKFHTYFVLASLAKLFTSIGTVNQALQSATLQLQHAKHQLDNLHALLQTCRNDFDLFYKTTVDEAKGLGLSDPVVPRIAKRPARLAEGTPSHVFKSPESYYRQLFFDLVDNASAGIVCRFSSEIFTFLGQVETAIVNSSSSTKFISDFYGDDLDSDRLQLHVKMFQDVAHLRNKKVLTTAFNLITDYEKVYLDITKIIYSTGTLAICYSIAVHNGSIINCSC
jgi:Domain of unknown function (DUF4371)